MSKYTTVPVSKVSVMPEEEGEYRLIKDHFWVLDDDDNILIYNKQSVQCNKSEQLALSLVANERHPGTKVLRIPAVWIKMDFNF